MFFQALKVPWGTYRYFQVLLGILSIFGNFWVFLGIVLYQYCIDIVSILNRHCINTYRVALGGRNSCLSFPDARDCCPLGLVLSGTKVYQRNDN